MKKIVTIVFAVGFLIVAGYCTFEAYRSHRIFTLSRGTSEANIRLDLAGTSTVTVNPPGRSLFRPGGLLEIFVSRDGVPLPLENVALGRGNLRITDKTGTLCLEQPLGELSVMDWGDREYFCPHNEFDTSQGGPYLVEFEIIEPFHELAGTSQKLVARHVVYGKQALIHFVQFAIAGLSGAISLFLAWRIFAAKKKAAVKQ